MEKILHGSLHDSVITASAWRLNCRTRLYPKIYNQTLVVGGELTNGPSPKGSAILAQ